MSANQETICPINTALFCPLLWHCYGGLSGQVDARARRHGSGANCLKYTVFKRISGNSIRCFAFIVAGRAQGACRKCGEIAKLQPDRRNQPPVISLACMGGPAIREKAVWIGIGAMARPVRVSHASVAQAVQSVRWQIEHHPVALALGKETRVPNILGQKVVQQGCNQSPQVRRRQHSEPNASDDSNK